MKRLTALALLALSTVASAQENSLVDPARNERLCTAFKDPALSVDERLSAGIGCEITGQYLHCEKFAGTDRYQRCQDYITRRLLSGDFEKQAKERLALYLAAERK